MQKIQKAFNLLFVLILIIAGMYLIPVPVAAAGTIATSLTTGPIGSQVTVSGSGFTSDGDTYVWFADTAFGPYRAIGGAMSASIQVPLLPRIGSSYQIHVQDVSNAANNSNYIYFNITPQIAIGATTASAGDSITVYGNGYYASSPVSIYFDNAIIATVNTDTKGAFDGASFLVPPAFRGTHTVKGKDSSESSQPINLSIESKLTASPSSGGSGDAVTLTGTGFIANGAITFYWDDAVISSQTATSDLNGGFMLAGFNIPTSSNGTHKIKAQDVNSNSAVASFNISTKIVISPASGLAGIPVTIKGTGFDAGKTISLKYNSLAISPSAGTATSDSSGGFTATFVVTAGPTGSFTVDAYDGKNLAQATFSQISEIKFNLETSATQPGYVGQSGIVTGNGLLPGVTVSVYFASDTTLISTATTDGNGHFSTTFNIPAASPGAHTITVTDTLTIKSFPFYIESQVPPAPELVTPKDADKLLDPGTFNWEKITDPSGITYTLQITTDRNFSGGVIEKKGLDQPSYTLTAAEKLPANNASTPYYWRVKASDGTGTNSDWSAIQSFNVESVFELSAWMIGLMIGIGGILLFLLGFLLGRKAGTRG